MGSERKAGRPPGQTRRRAAPPAPAGRDEYESLLRLERLESLLEEMRELGVGSQAEVEREIAALHRRLDEEGEQDIPQQSDQ